MDGLFSPPPMISGLLGAEEAERLRKQSIGTGIVSALIGGLAAAPNYRYTGIAPILGQALQSGFQGMQGTYTSALENYQTQQKIAEQQRQQQERQQMEQTIQSLSPEDQALFRLIGPSGYGQIVAKRAEPAKSPFADINPKDYTPESLRTFGQTRDVADLMPREPADKKFKVGDLRDFVQGTEKVTQEYQPDGTWKSIAKGAAFAPPSSTVVNVGDRGLGKFVETVGSELGREDVALRGAAQQAPEILEGVQRARKILKSGQVITGFGANKILDVAKLGQQLGITGANVNETIANTEGLFRERAKSTLAAVKASGLGAGTGFSNTDREFLEKAQLGNIGFSEKALLQQIEIEERVARKIADKWNKRLSTYNPQVRSAFGLEPVEIQSAPAAGGNKIRVDY